MLDAAKVALHNSRRSCWIIIHGRVYDVTDFLDEHPGGASTILKFAGHDATDDYAQIHPPNMVLEGMSVDKQLGIVDPTTLTKLGPQSDKPAVQATPTLPLEMCIDLDDIEKAGRSVISEKARTYISSAADSLHSLENNLSDWSKIVFRPRVLRNVTTVDLSTYILGVHCRLPFFVAPTGLVGLTHPDGELCLVRGAAQTGVHCGVSTASTRSREDIIECMKAEQNKLPKSLRGVSHVLFQLYVNSDAEITKTIVRQARELGYKGLFITVDTPVSGKRNADSRLRAREELESGISRKPALAPEKADESENLRLRAAGGLSKTLNWTDLSWIRKAWSGPIVLKGIQRWEDAKQAVLMGVEGIYLSNHGGRQLHSAPSSLNTLIEIRTYCPEILERCEIYVDGGIRRGGDIIKALCLGAKAVGIGRPFLYAIGAHGVDGFLRAVSILDDEMRITMRLLGATTVRELHPEMVNAWRIEKRIQSLGLSSRI